MATTESTITRARGETIMTYDYVLATPTGIIRASRLYDALPAGHPDRARLDTLARNGTRYSNEDFDVLSSVWSGLGWPDLAEPWSR